MGMGDDRERALKAGMMDYLSTLKTAGFSRYR